MPTLLQNYIVYQDGSNFSARGQLDGQELTGGEDVTRVIQTAIDSLSGGGEVYLSRGDFPLKSPIQLKDYVLLRGSGRGTRLRVANPELGLICKGLKGTVIADLAVHALTNSEAGIVIDNSGDCQIRNVLTQGFAGYGIWVRNNTFMTHLQSCTAADNGRANIYLENLAGGGRGGDFLPNLIANCATYGGGTGIECNKVIVLNIVGCIVFQPGEYGYHLYNTSNSVLISGCRSFQVERDALRVESTHELNVTGNIFCWHRGNGMVLSDVSWGAINGNEVIDSGVRTRDGSYTTGIILSENTRGVQVSGNTIFNWGDQVPMQYGVAEDASCRNNLVSSNNINFYTETDVVSKGENTLVRGNVSQKDNAYQGMGRPGYPDFDRARITQFIGI